MSDNALYAFGITAGLVFITIFFGGLIWSEHQSDLSKLDAISACIDAGNTPADCAVALDK